MYTALALANLFGHLLGAKGKIFIFEMDEVEIVAAAALMMIDDDR